MESHAAPAPQILNSGSPADDDGEEFINISVDEVVEALLGPSTDRANAMATSIAKQPRLQTDVLLAKLLVRLDSLQGSGRHRVTWVLAHWGKPTPQVIEALWLGVRAPDVHVQLAATEGLLRAGVVNDAVARAVTRLMQAQDWGVREQAVGLLAEFRGRSDLVIEPLRLGLVDESRWIVSLALEAATTLGRDGTPLSDDILQAIAASEDDSVRSLGVVALAAIHGEEPERLVWRAVHGEPVEQAVCTEALDRLGAAATPFLMDVETLLSSADARVRVEAARLLIHRGQALTLSWTQILDALSAESPDASGHAATALRRLAPLPDWVLDAAMVHLAHNDLDVRLAVAFLLAGAEEGQFEALGIMTLMSSGSVSTRVAVVVMIGARLRRVGLFLSATTILRMALTDEEEAVRKEALGVISAHAGVAPSLRASVLAAAADGSPSVRRAAVFALNRLEPDDSMAQAALRALGDDPDEAVRAAVAIVLGE